MAEKKCTNHPERDAIALCYQCHKPVCNACMTVTEHGNFCSPTCDEQYKQAKLQFQKGAAEPKKRGVGFKLVILLIVIIAILVIIHLVAKYGEVEALSKIDVIQMILGTGSE